MVTPEAPTPATANDDIRLRDRLIVDAAEEAEDRGEEVTISSGAWLVQATPRGPVRVYEIEEMYDPEEIPDPEEYGATPSEGLWPAALAMNVSETEERDRTKRRIGTPLEDGSVWIYRKTDSLSPSEVEGHRDTPGRRYKFQ